MDQQEIDIARARLLQVVLELGVLSPHSLHLSEIQMSLVIKLWWGK